MYRRPGVVSTPGAPSRSSGAEGRMDAARSGVRSGGAPRGDGGRFVATADRQNNLQQQWHRPCSPLPRVARVSPTRFIAPIRATTCRELEPPTEDGPHRWGVPDGGHRLCGPPAGSGAAGMQTRSTHLRRLLPPFLTHFCMQACRGNKPRWATSRGTLGAIGDWQGLCHCCCIPHRFDCPAAEPQVH